jgi:Fe-S-cluster containining protein
MKTEDWVTGQITLSVHGAPLEMQMTVPAKPVKPQRMLPIFGQIANSFTDLGVKAIEDANQKISCKKGCGACCRQPVPLAEIEAYQIAELVENLPEPRRSEIKNRFEKACQHFQNVGWFERLDNCADLTSTERKKIISDYFFEGVACPFLENESCSIHQDRPLACREYLVTSAAEHCATFSAETIKTIGLPIKPSESLRKVGQTRELHPINFIPLILALEWAEKYPEKFAEKTGEQWMADFFRNLTDGEIPKE